jgi:hypothetical protein
MNQMNQMNQIKMESILIKHLPIRVIEKKKYGEVFTPKELIDRMLDHLPEKVFQNPYLKWLDPCAGIGNFMVIVYFRLMKGLEIWEPIEDKRSKHILQSMLYMVELNRENIDLCRKLFQNSINIIEGDFLKIDMGNKFDIILGNPPFQEKVNKGGKNKLYERILLKCLSLSPEYLLFITPDNLFSGGSKAYLKLIEESVEIICFDKALQLFFPKIQQYVCYFLYKKAPFKTGPCKTTIIGNTGARFECYLIDRPVNPVRNWSLETEQLIQTYLLDNKNNGIYNRGKNLCEYEGSIELIFSPFKKLYSNKICIGLGIKKIVLFLISPNLEFKTDFEGKYGVGPNTFYLPINNLDEGLKLEQWFNSDIYKQIAYACKTSRQFLKLKMIQHLNIEKIIK